MQIATHASLDWNVLELPLVADLPNGEKLEVGNRKVLVRDDNYAQLGVVGKTYEVVQNSILNDLVSPLVSEGLVKVTNTGYLKNGSKVFIQAQMTEEFNIVGENHRSMITLLNSHDGTTHFSAGVTDVRVICGNTFAMAYDEMSTRLQHTLGVTQKALNISETINYVNERMRRFSEAAEKLSTTTASVSKVDQMIEMAYGKQPGDKVRNRDEIVDLFYNGRGNGGRTFYDAFNAITEFNTHKSRKTENDRFGYANFGTGASIARRAIDAALALV